jgi:hypothetical protein
MDGREGHFTYNHLGHRASDSNIKSGPKECQPVAQLESLGKAVKP